MTILRGPFFKKIVQDYTRWKEVIILSLGFFVGVFLNWPAVEIVVLLIFLWALVHSIQSKYFALAAFVLMTVVPPLLFLKKSARADEFAVDAYYFLCIAVVLAAREIRRDEKKQE